MKKLKAENLKRYCDPKDFDFRTTAEVLKRDVIIGQSKAMETMKLGLKVPNKSYNLFLAGAPGTGRTTMIRHVIQKIAPKKPVPSDWAYVFSFDKPDNPCALELPPGRGRRFQKDMDEMISMLKVEIPHTFEAPEYEDKVNKIMKQSQKKEEALLLELERACTKHSFKVKVTSTGILAIPLVDGKTLTDEQYFKLSEAKRKEMEQKRKDLEPVISRFTRMIRKQKKRTSREVLNLRKDVGLFIVGSKIDDLVEVYGKYPQIRSYLDKVKAFILDNMQLFLSKEEDDEEHKFLPFQVNVLMDNSETKGAPIVFETNPTFYNLFGKIEKRVKGGVWQTDFTMIKEGSFHKANGGFLVLNIRDVLLNPGAWEGLKRVIKNQELTLEDLSEHYGLLPTSGLKPEPIPVNVKVTLIGNHRLYQLLYTFDEEFGKLFKLRADFDVEMDYNKRALKEYATYIAKTCEKHKLKHLNPDAVAEVINYGARLADDRRKLSLFFNRIHNLLTESNYWATNQKKSVVDGKCVRLAIKKQRDRLNLFEEKIQERIRRQVIMIDVEGKAIGQINALYLYKVGDFYFSSPCKLTASTFMGTKGVINIEREAELSGPIHIKAMQIVSGYLGSKFARNFPLSITATICFEQSYGSIEGDSASVAELLSLLSSLANVPLAQHLAVTGSINQKGRVQPIGGVNEKIEGFYEVSRQRSKKGIQGVVIPQKNLDNLMLREDIIDAVKRKKFHIYAINHVDEAIELFTGMKAGKMAKKGTYTKGSFYQIIYEKLEENYKRVYKKEVGGG